MVQWMWAGGWLQIMVHRIKLYQQEEDHFKIAFILSSFASKISLIWCLHELKLKNVYRWCSQLRRSKWCVTGCDVTWHIWQQDPWHDDTETHCGDESGSLLAAFRALSSSPSPAPPPLKTHLSPSSDENSPLIMHALAHHHHPLINIFRDFTHTPQSFNAFLLINTRGIAGDLFG